MKQFFFGSFIVLTLLIPTFTVAQSTTGTSSTTTNSFNAPAVKSWFDRTYAKTEVFRKKQQAKFVAMRDELKVKLKIDQKEPETSIDIGIAGTDKETPKAYSQLDNPLDYGKYIFATSMVTAFSNPLLFYIGGLLLAFLVLKFIIRMVV